MSLRYKGGVLSATPPTTSSSAAPGIWTLEQQLQATAGTGWPSGFAPYIEDVFSTYLYTGNDAALTVTNGINLSTYGGLVWGKSRSASQNHRLYDTARGSNYSLISNDTAAQSNQGTNACAFNTDGFSLSAASGIVGSAGFGGPNYASWTFRKQAKFFDIVTYTGDGTNRTIAHNLGSVPGCIIVKKTSGADNWFVQHRSLGATKYIALNDPDIAYTNSQLWNNTEPTSTVFTLGTNSGVNQSGSTYVAYLFAHDAGGFGLTGSDNVISCGSYTGGTFDGVNYAAVTTTLGFEPQWVLVKETTGTNAWFIFDNMRGIATGGVDARLSPNSTNQEFSANWIDLTSTGFTATVSDGSSGINNGSSNTYIYIAIRRGPMKVPTTGTSVFYPTTYSGNVAQSQNAGFNGDLLFIKQRTAGGDRSIFIDRLRGWSLLNAASTSAQLTPTDFGLSNSQFPSFVNSASNGVSNYAYIPVGDAGWNGGANTYVDYVIARAPGFFDEVCTSVFVNGTLITHNLGVTPQLILVKTRDTASNWMGAVNDGGNIRNLSVNTTSGGYLPSLTYSSYFNASTIDPAGIYNGAGGSSKGTILPVAIYLFATCPGVSKVGSYTGTAALLTVNCGFTAGARFVLIKRTDSTGDWYLYDSARGISSGNDPYLLMNTADIEVTGTNYVDTDTTGFKVTAAAPAGLNANGGTYIFLAIA